MKYGNNTRGLKSVARAAWLNQIAADAAKRGTATVTLRNKGATTDEVVAHMRKRGLETKVNGNTILVAKAKVA